ncbi:hypothetical protein [Methylocystis hirsuta]|uniref:Uncharacterized protein n=1 Tax=Methylocystis hirsuta TaxID=369798 RepID=A0A3M9XQV2_9HYPH|nr:hypothetical protein [Methylocystis hirsuta]RNJ50215.1 hypothetical protein D1O30_12030 [Methylocystis hirsuta]
MSDKYSVEFNEPQSGGHPHDLLARLYREIGISAVAAALEVEQFARHETAAVERLDDHRMPPAMLLGDELAA